MDQAQGAASTGESVETTQTQPEPEVRGPKSEVSPLQAAVRKELGVEGGGQRSEEEPEERDEGVPAPEEQEPEQTEEQPAEEPAAAEAEEQQVHEDWPATAKARVAEEARKRRERTAERDEAFTLAHKWKAEAEQLAAQLQQATAVQLKPTRVLSEVVDRQSLTAAENHWKELRRFARTNPDGADDVLVGTNPDGTEKRRDYSREQIIQMGLDADEAIEALPAREKFVEQAEAQIAQAKAVYPDLWKATEAGQQAAGIVQRAPWILQEPDWAFVIGDYLAGRKMRLAKSGKGGGGKALSPGAQAILGAPKMAAAPGVIKSRSASSGPGPTRGGGGERVDTKQADEEFYAKGMTNEALEDKIRRKLAASQGGRTGGKQAALV